MGKSAPSPPPAPDVAAQAAAQGTANLDAARATNRMNRVDTSNPFLRTTYGEGENDRWSQNTTFAAPWMQDTFNTAAARIANPLTLQNMPPVYNVNARTGQIDGATGAVNANTGAIDPNLGRVNPNTGAVNANTGAINRNAGTIDPMTGQAARDQTQEALMARMQPGLERERAALDTQLRNQGLSPGSDGWRESMDDYNRQANDARLGAIAQSGQELDRERAWGANTRDAARDWELGVSDRERGWATNLGDRDRDWANSRSESDRAFGLQSSAADRNWQTTLGDRARDWQLDLGDRERNWMQSLRGNSEADRSRAISEMLMVRQTPMNELISMSTGQFGGNASAGGASVAPVDMQSLYGNQQAAQQAAYQGRVSATNANNQAAASAAAAAAMAAAVA